MPQSREIPKLKVQAGIDLCKKNVYVFLETAEILIKSGNLNHAAINLEFGIEEYGKILMLKDEFAKSADPMQVQERVFRSHKNKSERAWRIGDPDSLDVKYKMISERWF
ncbi:MAG: AbiV family abortive infection protein [Candidatus Bathyarchaeia archaeon]|jgi:AbiV family abortive infection protein